MSKFYLRYLEIDLTNKCNLNCAYCSHFSPLADYNIMNYDLETFKKDINRLGELFDISIIRLLGGEPFLVENILEYCSITREVFPNTKINIVTNGILKNKITEMLDKLNALNIVIKTSNYPGIDGFKNTNSKLNKEVVHFRSTNLNLNSKYNGIKSKLNCDAKDCLSLYNGRIYFCPIMKNISTLEKAFNINFNFNINDISIDIYNNSAEDIFLNLNLEDNWTKLCSHCNYTYKGLPWKLSEKCINEWVETEEN